MSTKVTEILSLNDEQVQEAFSVHCNQMDAEGLIDIKFCIKGYDSVEEIQRQFLAIEQMYEEGLTTEVTNFELFNEAYETY